MMYINSAKKNNFLNFLSYTQFYYPNRFKFVPLQNKQCLLKNHTSDDVGIWNSNDLDINTALSKIKNLSQNPNLSTEVGIHTSKDVFILDIDCIETSEGNKQKLTDNQKNIIIKFFGTLAQKTGGGVHLFFNNDLKLESSSTGRYFDVNGYKLKYDIRGVSTTLVGIKDIENSFSFNKMRNISTFKDFLNIENKTKFQTQDLKIIEEDIKYYYEEPTPQQWEEDLKKLYEIQNIFDGYNFEDIKNKKIGEGNRHPTFTQLMLRGAAHGINFHVLMDQVEELNNQLYEPLNEKRMQTVYKVGELEPMKTAYQNYEIKRRNNMSKTLNPNLRMYVNFVNKLDNGKQDIQGSTKSTDKDGVDHWTSYKVIVNSSNVYRKGDLVDIPVTKINWKEDYKDKKTGEVKKLKTPLFEGFGFEPKIVTEKTFKGTPFGISVTGILVNDTKRVSDVLNTMYIKNFKGDALLQLKTLNELTNVKGKHVVLPLTSFNSTKIEDGSYRASASVSKFISNESIEGWVIKPEEQLNQNDFEDKKTGEETLEDSNPNFSEFSENSDNSDEFELID